MKREYLVVLNFEIGDVQILPYDSNAYENVEEFALELEETMGIELNLNNSQHMVTEDLKITIL